MRGSHVRPLVVVALTVLAAIAVIGGALGVRAQAAPATVNDLPPVAISAAAMAMSTQVTAGEPGLTPQRAVPVDRDLPAAVGRTAVLVVLLGAFLLFRRHPAAAASAGSGRPRPPRTGPTARSARPGLTPGLLRV